MSGANYSLIIGGCKLEAIADTSDVDILLGGHGFRIASNLGNMGDSVTFCTALPETSMADMFRSALLSLGVRLHVKTLPPSKANIEVQTPTQVLSNFDNCEIEQEFIKRAAKEASCIIVTSEVSTSTIKQFGKLLSDIDDSSEVLVLANSDTLSIFLKYEVACNIIVDNSVIEENTAKLLGYKSAQDISLKTGHTIVSVFDDQVITDTPKGKTYKVKAPKSKDGNSRHGRLDFIASFLVNAIVSQGADIASALSALAPAVADFNKLSSSSLSKSDTLEDYVSNLVVKAHTDRLTGAQNREGVLSWLSAESHTEDDFCSIILDIDFFKKINDTYGHNVGDEVLVQVARVLQECVRDEDIVGRWGGEEFICFVKAPLKIAQGVAERMRLSIEKTVFSSIPNGVTISAGVAPRRKHEEIDILIERADKALYQAKSNGRNQVCIS